MQKENGTLKICSKPYPGEEDWRGLPNNVIKVF
jgi:hypothetical protein